MFDRMNNDDLRSTETPPITPSTKPDFNRASQYALERLRNELSPGLYYHSLWHTSDEVVLACERLGKLEGIDNLAMMLVKTAAWFHDLGFVLRYTNNEIIAADMAGDVLPAMGYTIQQVEAIQGMIMATRLPQTTHNHLEEIVADADLDVLGREDFLPRNQALRDELLAVGTVYDDVQWYSSQLKFIQNHHYFTASAHKLRDARKAENIAILGELLVHTQKP
jgi:uncharacterized protein